MPFSCFVSYFLLFDIFYDSFPLEKNMCSLKKPDIVPSFGMGKEIKYYDLMSFEWIFIEKWSTTLKGVIIAVNWNNWVINESTYSSLVCFKSQLKAFQRHFALNKYAFIWCLLTIVSHQEAESKEKTNTVPWRHK